MTVGNLFLLILLIIAVIFIVAYVICVCAWKCLKKKGYKNPKEVVKFHDVAFLTFWSALGIGVLTVFIHMIITNWNVII